MTDVHFWVKPSKESPKDVHGAEGLKNDHDLKV